MLDSTVHTVSIKGRDVTFKDKMLKCRNIVAAINV